MFPDTKPGPSAHAFDATTDTFETEVLQGSMQVPVLIDFWAEWCGPCKSLGPVLEKLAVEYNGAFRLAKVDVDKEQELAAAFQVRSIPTVILVKDGQPLDGFSGALPEGQLREFLSQHGVVPGAAAPEPIGEPAAVEPADPHAEVVRLRKATEIEPENADLRLDLALALLRTGGAREAEQLLDALPANLSTDDRAIGARARLDLATAVQDAPPMQTLEAAVAADPGDLRALHLLGVQRILGDDVERGLEHLLEMLRRDRGYGDGLARRTLIDAFRVIDDAELVGRFRRRMSSLLLA